MELILAILSTYGISTLISEYDGPFNLFVKLRNMDVSKVTSCSVCLSVWIAIPVSIIIGLTLVYYLSVIGAVILLNRIEIT